MSTLSHSYEPSYIKITPNLVLFESNPDSIKVSIESNDK